MSEVSIPVVMGITLCLVIMGMWIYEKSIKFVGPWGAMGFFVIPAFGVGGVGYIFSRSLYVFLVVVLIAIYVESYLLDNKLAEIFPKQDL